MNGEGGVQVVKVLGQEHSGHIQLCSRRQIRGVQLSVQPGYQGDQGVLYLEFLWMQVHQLCPLP